MRDKEQVNHICHLFCKME